MKRCIEYDEAFMNLMSESKSNTEVYLLMIGPVWEGPTVTGLFETYDLAVLFLANDGRMEGVEPTENEEGRRWYGESEDYWAEIKPQRVLSLVPASLGIA